MPHSTTILPNTSSNPNRSSTYMTSTPAVVGTAHSPGRDSLPSVVQRQSSSARKRASASVAEAYAELLGKGGHIDEVLLSRQPGDRSSMASQYNNASKHRTQYYEDQFRYKDNEVGTVRERVQRESPVIAELKTNVIIKDEFTLVTDLSYHLAQRYTRPDSSIMIKVDHSACLALGGTFDPCYIITVTALPSQMGPTTNKRNAALIQSFLADILSVPQDRGIVKFLPIEECNYAMNGNTMLGEIERLEKAKGEDNGGSSAVKRMLTNNNRKSVPSFKRSTPTLDTNIKSPNGASEEPPVSAVTASTPLERKRRSTHTDAPNASALPDVFELAATTSNDRPTTASGPYPAFNGLRMNGISKEDLLASASKTPNGRPKTFAGQTAPADQDEPMPSMHRQSSQRQNRNSVAGSSAPNRKSNIPTSPKPERTTSSYSTIAPNKTSDPSTTRPTTASGAAAPIKPRNTYLDGVSTAPSTTATKVEERSDPKLDAKAGEKNRQLDGSRDPAANTAKRRSTANVTATPKMPPPPPVPASRPTKVPAKRKSFLSAFRRS